MGCVWSNADLVGSGYRIKIVKQIAEGGFSQILLCTDIDSNESYAVKKIGKHSRESIERIETEASIHKSLSNLKNVVPLLATIDTEHMYYLVFPFCKRGSVGEELLQRRLKKDYLSQEVVVRVFLGLCSAVHALHKLGLFHRDLKVANILWADDGTPMLTDFGSATTVPIRIESTRDQRCAIDEAAELCSMSYRAPELFDCAIGSIITESADLWSLGCCLYALCYFVSPFDLVYEKGDSVALAVQSPEKIEYPELKQFDNRLAMIMRCLLVVDASKRMSIEEAVDIVTSLEVEGRDTGVNSMIV